MSETTPTTVRLTAKERDIAEKLGNYLYLCGKIDQPTTSNVLRVALKFLHDEIIKAIEAERYGKR